MLTAGEADGVSAFVIALAPALGAPSTGGMGWIVAVGVVGLLGAAWWVYRNSVGREQLERELELLLPGTRVSAESGDPAVQTSAKPEAVASSRLREQAREWIASEPERAALVLAAWANDTEKLGAEGRHGAA